MVGLAVLLVASWFALRVIKWANLDDLGLILNRSRAQDFLLGFLLTFGLCAGFQGSIQLVFEGEWVLNPSFGWTDALIWFGKDVQSVFTEELVFRGVILIALIHYLNEKWAILITALAFGIYHWFSMGVFGNPMLMGVILIGTGLMGVALALAYTKTRSLYLPVALHLGWNFCQNTIFSKGPWGNGLFTYSIDEMQTGYFGLTGLIGIPFLLIFIVQQRWGKEKGV